MREELRGYMDGEMRLTHYPAKRNRKLLVLDHLARAFETGRTYTEPEVNDLLRRLHTFDDPALLRRELVDAGLMDRDSDGREYRRHLFEG